MYWANRSDGKSIYLSKRQWCRKELTYMKRKHRFFCPQCMEEVVLKLGERQAWHFAHQPISGCTFNRLNESSQHYQAKQAILEWLKAYQLEPEIEQYLPKLKQRPDICVKIANKHVVIEIQRSNIETGQFLKRHFGYIEAGYEPIWLGLITSQSIEKTSIYTQNHLDSILIRLSPKPHSIYYHIVKNEWILSSGFYFLKPRKTFVYTTILPFYTPPHELLFRTERYLKSPRHEPLMSAKIILSHWRKQTSYKRTMPYYSLTPTEKQMLRVFQQYQINLNHFPAICNIPLASQYLLDTPPHLWQSWFVIKIINKTKLNSHLKLSFACDLFEREKHFFSFTFRPTVQHERETIRNLLGEYLEILCQFHVVSRVYKGVYKVIHHVNVTKPLETLISDDRYVIDVLEKTFRKSD